MDKNYYCVIMAGGVGSRFWPISRNALPKQFLDILGIGKSFLQLTYDRFVKIVPKENIIVVTSATYVDLVRQHLPELPSENILAEPYRRNTAPCIAYAATKIRHQNPNATMVVAPSDRPFHIQRRTVYRHYLCSAEICIGERRAVHTRH